MQYWASEYSAGTGAVEMRRLRRGVWGLWAAALIASLPGPAMAQPAAAGEGVWSFPFEFVAGKIFVEVTVNGRGPYPFIMDTGSPPTIIDSDLAEDLGMKVTPMGRVGGAGEGSAEMFGVDAV